MDADKNENQFQRNMEQIKQNIMKTKIGILFFALCTSFFSLQAQNTVTSTRALSNDISDNLDLEAVASIFGDSENLEDFEHRLNDPENHLSNLDLNQDGYIDYLRVVENSTDQNSLIVIQAVLDKDVYQDVATLEIEKTNNGTPRVQIVGDSYIYGSNYIIEPVFVHTPLIFSFFWGPRYIAYQSPYYWNNYPRWYSNYRPYSAFKYERHVNLYVNRYNTYNHTNTRNFQISGDRYNQIRRNDFATRHPERAFESRNKGIRNSSELNERRPGNSGNLQRGNSIQKSNNRQIQNNSSSNSRRNVQGNVNQNRRPVTNVQSGSNPTRTRENNNINNNRSRPAPSNGPAQMKSANIKEGNSVSPRRSIIAPNRSANRVESAKRSSVPRAKPSSVSRKSGSNGGVKQASPSGNKSESGRGKRTRE